MKITALEEYGLRCLLQLAKEPRGSLITVSEIAQRESLSNEYVSKIMTLLRRGGLVESVRGVAGGYRLVKTPTEITIADLSYAVSQPLFDDEFCPSHKGLSTECVHTDLCGVRNVRQLIADRVHDAMKDITLDQVITNQKTDNFIGVLDNEKRAVSN